MLTSTLFLLAASSIGTFAAPTPKSSTTATSFSVPALLNPNHKVNGAAAYRKALLKYGAPLPAALSSSTIKRRQNGTGSVVANDPDNQDNEYICPVDIGGETLNLDFDTGSADLWVFSTELSSSLQGSHAIFDSSKATDFKELDGATWKISYGDGSSASGDVGTAPVTVGGLTVPGQAVELAKTVASSFTSGASDGLLGLAFSTINTVSTPQLTFTENAISQNLLTSPVFTADLKQGAAGSYTFGTIDSSQYTGDISYTSVDSSKGFWQFGATKYAIDGGDLVDDSNTAALAIADTGTTLLLMSDEIVKAYYAKVTNAVDDTSAGGWTVPCTGDLPSLTVSVGANQAVIPGSLLRLDEGSGTCFGGLQSNSGIDFYIYGDIFLKSVLAIFDYNKGSPQFGYASKTDL